MKRACVWVLSVAAAACGENTDPARQERPLAAPSRPHIVLYLVDTLRRDRLGCYGASEEHSPEVDALARQSVVFDRCFAPAPWTLPSVISLMTSTLPLEHQVLVPGQQVAPDARTLAVRLRDLGYHTGAFVMNPFGGEAAGLGKGYDVTPPDAGRSHEVPLTEVARFLDERPDRPFFLYLHSTEPHRPYKAPPEFEARFGVVDREARRTIRERMREFRALSSEDFDEGRPLGTTDHSLRQAEILADLALYRREVDVLYDAGVAWASANLGKTVQLLRSRGVFEDTLLVFVSDHGEELYDRGGWLHHQHLYGELTHVPMLWHLPGQTETRRVSATASLIDVLPTLLDLLGALDPDEKLSGRSLLPQLCAFPGASGESDQVRMVSHRVNRLHHFAPDKARRGDLNLGLVKGRFKGIWNVEPDTFELYDLDEDGLELCDLADAEPEVARFLRREAERWWSEHRSAEPAPAASLEHLDEETLERLRELGYIR